MLRSALHAVIHCNGFRATRSIYALTREEIARGVANRFVHSRTYIFLYLSMAALSVTTVILSLTDGCPGLAFYILEVIINTSMILEVTVRFIALGKVRKLFFSRGKIDVTLLYSSNSGNRRSISWISFSPCSVHLHC